MTQPFTPSIRGLLSMAIPLSGAMASQAIINMVDTALVGNLGGLALASVSIGSYLAFIMIAIPVGFAIGMQSIISQHKEHHDYNHWLMAGVSISFVLSILLYLIGYWIAPLAIDLYVVDDRMSGVAQSYFDWRLLSIPGISLSLAARSFWASQYKPWHYSRLLIITHILNVPISYACIYGLGPVPAMGAAGAGFGTTISIYIGLALQLIALPRGLFWHNLGLTLHSLPFWPNMLKAGLPGAIQQLAFTLHLAVLLWIISSLGATPLAAAFTVLNIGLVILLPLMGIAQATSSLVAKTWSTSASIAYQWSRLACLTAFGLGILALLLVSLIKQPLLDLMLVNRELVLLAGMALPIYALALIFDSLSQIATRSLIATQAPRKGAIINIIAQWGLLLPITAISAPIYGFMAIWWLQVGYRLLLGIGLWATWRSHISKLAQG